MLTLFGIPKPFEGHIGVIQRNAIRSWSLLGPEVEVILFGDDDGVAEFAAEVGVQHVADIRKNEQGTPLLSDAFNEARNRSKGPLLGYANCDIMLLDNFVPAVSQVAEAMPDRFLMIGRRIDTDITEEFDPNDPEWRQGVLAQRHANGKIAPRVCKDYFIFPKTLYQDMPDFAVGRGHWDNWMVYHAHETNTPVVDATAMLTAIHQNHDYKHLKKGFLEAMMGKEASANCDLIGRNVVVKGSAANWQLTKRGVQKKWLSNPWLTLLCDLHRMPLALSKMK